MFLGGLKSSDGTLALNVYCQFQCFPPLPGEKALELHVYTSIQTPTGDINAVHESYFSGLPSGTFYPLLNQKNLEIASGSFTFEYREYVQF